ncbi:Lipase 3, partial [Armadillidium nasatum]
VKLLIALGPVAFLENMGGPLSLLTGYTNTLKFLTEILGVYEVLPSGAFMNILTSTMCDPAVTTVAPICDNILLSLIGLDTSLMDKKLLPRILAHTPAGTSVQNMIHFMQAKNSGRFQMYSYGPTVNVQKIWFKIPS